jgi:hypothetical protein
MRKLIIVLWMVLCSVASAAAQVTISIGIDLNAYPELVPVSGYPVYFAPRVDANYFFYDGAYWVYERDSWYRSSWYNGPWQFVAPESVPLFILRVPVRYYRQPPAYFGGWHSDAPPRWGDHWGNAWEERRRGWDRWNRSAVPAPAPLPVYQRQYSGDRYPRAEEQQILQSRNYRYQSRETTGQQRYQTQRAQSDLTAPVSSPQGRQATSQEKIPAAQDQRGSTRPSSLQQSAAPTSRGPPPQSEGEDVRRRSAAPAPAQQSAPPAQYQRQQPPQGATQQQQPPHGQDKGAQGKGPPQEPKRQEKGHDKGEQRSGERNQ